MVSLVETIARSLVDNPDEVVVREIPGNDPGVTVVELKVAASDMGKIIGKQGRIVKALRTVVKAAAVKQNKKVVVEIVS
ncbi:MAG: KH domain-containing protein [Firmicutes bacterium]|nr:KH domain-containing protein [Bacillota bacterium]